MQKAAATPIRLCMLQMASGDVCFPWSGSGACLYPAAGRPHSPCMLELCGPSRWLMESSEESGVGGGAFLWGLVAGVFRKSPLAK